jgi:hypothetical protein
VSDLCAAGWHVCASPDEVSAAGVDDCLSIDAVDRSYFYIAAVSGPGGRDCGVGLNNIFGCGNVSVGAGESCAPLNRFAGTPCAFDSAWNCGPDAVEEAANVTKASADRGGALCCRD